MRLKRNIKLLTVALSFSMLGVGLRAYPAFLKTYAADPAAKPELRTQCATCHINPAGSGPRNEFGQAFAAAGNKITEALRQQFPDRFVTPDQASGAPQVSFVDGSESQVIIESGGKKFLVDAKSRTVKEVGLTSVGTTATAIAAQPAPAATKATANEKVYQQMDVRLISLPTAKPIEKGALYGDFTHRFPFDDNITNASELFGLDGFAVPSFGFTYGLTDRFHVGAYRSPSVVGRPILLFAGASLLDENKGQPFTAMGRVGLEGRDNFQRNFTTSFELTLARSITNKAQLYFVPTLSLNNRPFGAPEENLPKANTFAIGLGGALNIRPTVALLAESNWRVNEAGKFGNRGPVFGFGIEKTTISRRHSFSLVFSNGAGTTFAQRSATRASLLGSQADDSIRGFTIGFNISRRMF